MVVEYLKDERKNIFLSAVLVVFALLLAASLVLASLPSVAYAAGGVSCVGCIVRRSGLELEPSLTKDLVNPSPENGNFLHLEFDKNVAYANPGVDDSFVRENLAKVHLFSKAGVEIEGYRVEAGGDSSYRQVIYLYLDKWLDPLTEYVVVVEEGIQAANGEDVSTERYEFQFKTNDQCENGFSIFMIIGLPIVVAVLVLGSVVTAVRNYNKRGRRRL